jgi:tRNA1(Val) A37 N6-methylase TrmN6
MAAAGSSKRALLLSIAQTKNVTILNIDEVQEKTVAMFKLEVECNSCGAIKEPTIHDFKKKPEQQCKCARSKVLKTNLPTSLPDGWKYIHSLTGPLADKYDLRTVEPYYAISTTGKVQNVSTKIELKPELSESGHFRVNLKTNKHSTSYKKVLVDVLVGIAFIPMPLDVDQDEWDTLQIDHTNSEILDNNASNLQWVTPVETITKKAETVGQLGKSGTMWIDKNSNSVFFSKHDYETFCLAKDDAVKHTYKNFKERLSLEDTIDYPDEIWKHVKYSSDSNELFVSSRGRVYHEGLKRKTFGVFIPESNYLKFNGIKVHRIIASAFLQKELADKIDKYRSTKEELIISHKNGRKCDNAASNLEWLTRSERAKLAQTASNSSASLSAEKNDQASADSSASANSGSDSDGSADSTKSSKLSQKLPVKFRPVSVKVNKAIKVIKSNYSIDDNQDDDPDELIDLSEHLTKDGQIKISKADFTELKTKPNIVPSIMKFISQFDKPLLPQVLNLSQKYKHLAYDSTEVEHEGEEYWVTANNQGRTVLNHFMYDVMITGHPKNKPSYQEVWYDLKMRQKMVERMLSKDIRMNNGSLFGCYGCQYGKLYNFPSNIAKALYSHFDSKRVLDFCAGYGGRLLGFWASDAAEYVGIDPNTKIPYQQVIECLTKFDKHKKCQIIQACAEDVDYSELGLFDTIFTSPPYFDTEIYTSEKTQSCIRYKKFEQWLDKFLLATLSKVEKVLAPGGILAINIKDSKRHKIVQPMLDHLKGIKGLVEMNHIKMIHAKRYKSVNSVYEYIYVFRKADQSSSLPYPESGLRTVSPSLSTV